MTAGRPRGTTQMMTRGTTNDWYEVVGTRYCSYEVAAAGQSEHDTCHSACVSTRIPENDAYTSTQWLVRNIEYTTATSTGTKKESIRKDKADELQQAT
ncbi:hypothetical protein Tco_0991728 [Tanacetum coccineum]|uniref:Uncharacterized protein n=1 Tax=Tanacetum coccineum TaxID=301880 RepID=A0ABQ5F153_9ASTR